MKYLINFIDRLTGKWPEQRVVRALLFFASSHSPHAARYGCAVRLTNSHAKRQYDQILTVTCDASPRCRSIPNNQQADSKQRALPGIEKFNILIVHLRLKLKEEEVDWLCMSRYRYDTSLSFQHIILSCLCVVGLSPSRRYH